MAQAFLLSLYSSVADPGSGAFLTPGSGIRNRFFPDPRSRIPKPYTGIWELGDNFLVKKFYNSLIIGPNFFLQHFKNKIIYNFVKFVATKKGMTTNFFSPLPFVPIFGSEIKDPGSGKNIPDPQQLVYSKYFWSPCWFFLIKGIGTFCVCIHHYPLSPKGH